MNAERRIEKLRAHHKIEGFDCGREELNRYLLRYAWSNQLAGAAQTYVGLAGDSVIGYYTLAVGQVTREEAPERLTKGLARHQVPIVLLARLAVDRHWQEQGVGKSLLKTQCNERFRPRILPVSAPSLSTRRIRRREASMRNSILSRPPLIRCICSLC